MNCILNPTLSIPVFPLEWPVYALRVDEQLSAVVGGEGASPVTSVTSLAVCSLVLDRLHRLHDLALVNVLAAFPVLVVIVLGWGGGGRSLGVLAIPEAELRMTPATVILP